MAIVALGLLISAGSAFGAAVLNKKYETILPISCSGCIAIVFMFGILNHLRIGLYAIGVLAIGLYLSSAIFIVRKRNFSLFVNNFFTPALGILVAWMLFSLYIVYGLQFNSWDEFTHWGDVVKAMVSINDFSTSSLSNSRFPSYPPGMSIFQYVLQKINIKLGGDFSEWMTYYAYDLFIFCYLMPFLKNISKGLWQCLVALVCLLMPMLFYPYIFSSIYIDPVISIVTAFGLITIYSHEKWDVLYILNVISALSMLVLLKDAGFFFAVVILIDFCVDLIVRRKEINKTFVFVACPLGLISILGPKYLWNYNISLNKAYKNFPLKYNFADLLSILTGRDESYRSIVKYEFFKKLTTSGITLGNTGITINYVLLQVVMVLAIWYLVNKTRGKYEAMFTTAIVAFLLISYTVGLGVTYLFQFSEYEAVNLASFDRYLGIGYCSIWIFLVYLIIAALKKGDKIAGGILFGVVMIGVIPLNIVYDEISRKPVQMAAEAKKNYEILDKKVANNMDGISKIYIISQEDDGHHYWRLRFYMRPNTVNPDETWSIGEPFYDGDLYTISVTPEQWMDELVANYDYVAIYRCNEYFVEKYGYLFENQDYIQNNNLYYVDKESRKLKLTN